MISGSREFSTSRGSVGELMPKFRAQASCPSFVTTSHAQVSSVELIGQGNREALAIAGGDRLLQLILHLVDPGHHAGLVHAG